MSTPAEFEARLTAVETDVARLRGDVAVAAADASAARHLVAARDRDLADLSIKVEANRTAINALGVQTAAGFTEMRAKFDRVDSEIAELRTEMRSKFEQVDRGFTEMRGRFDQTAAGMAQIVELLTRRDDQ